VSGVVAAPHIPAHRAAVCALLQQQVLVRAAPELRQAGRQLSGTGRMPVLLWVVNQVGWLAGWLAQVMLDLHGYHVFAFCDARHKRDAVG
jgi:hypothetical protein